MKLLQIAGSFAPRRIGGPAVVVERLAVALRARGHDIAVLTAVDGPVLRHEVRGVPVVGVPSSDCVPDLLAMLRPDVVHGHSPRLLGTRPLQLAQAAGLPTVVSVYGAEPAWPTELRRGAAAVVVDTPEASASHVPVGALAPAPGWQRPTRRGPVRLGFLGGLDPDQGLATLLQALAALRRSDFALHVVDRATVAGVRQIREWDVRTAGLVRLVPGFDPWGADAFFGSIDVLLSLPQSAGHINLSVRDALARGVWPIATDIPANAAVIADGVSGDLVPVGAVEPLAAAIGRALDRDQSPLPAPVPTVDDMAAALERIYAQVAGG